MQKYQVMCLVGIILSVVLGGCTALADSDPPTVTFMVFGDPPEQNVYKSIVAAFEAKHPDIQIELLGLPSKPDYLARLSADFAAGAPPDVFLLNYRRLAQFHNRDAVEPLGPLLQESELIDENDFFNIATDAFRDGQGTLVCIPQNISSQVVYYNKDIFDAAGMPYPPADWTWAEMREMALALTRPDTDSDGEPDQYGLGLEPTLIRMAPFIWQNGGTLVDNEATPTTLTLDTPEAKEAMQFVINLAQIDEVVPNKTAEIMQAQDSRFMFGNIAMYVDSRRIVPTMREVAEFEWDVAPLPRGKQVASILHSDGYCLSKAVSNKDAAWTFIEFAMSKEGQTLAAKLGRTVPSLKHLAASSAFLDPNQPPANARVWIDAVPHIRVLPRLQNWVTIERAAAVEFEQAYMEHTSLEAAVSVIQGAGEIDFVPLK